jgi:hypothetical protein
MDLFTIITEAYTELTPDDFRAGAKIVLRDDSDGLGAYIYEWNYDKPIPDGLKLGKPTPIL